MNKPTIFILEEDTDTRLALNRMLIARGYIVNSKATREEAYQAIGDGLLKADVVLIDFVTDSIKETIKVGNFLRLNAKPNASLVVIATQYGEEVEGTSVQIGEKEHVVYLETGDELFDLLFRLTYTKAPTLLFSGIDE